MLLCRDGRVSDNTVCLIRKLLLLDPQQRLTAAEVLESLSGIIASWCVSQLCLLAALIPAHILSVHSASLKTLMIFMGILSETLS